MTPRDWDAASYGRVADPIVALGLTVLDRLALRGDETVLDAGCGTGAVTEQLVRRLVGGHVIAVDASPAMVATARERLGDRADVRVADLLELELERPVDAILSTATFHWIADHDALFARLHGLLGPGGRLVAQCGGEGNIASVRTQLDSLAAEPPYEDHLGGWRGPWRFASAADTESALTRAGFCNVRCWTEEAPVTPEEPCEFLSTMILGSHLERLPAALRARFLDDVRSRLATPLTIDYVRLNIVSTK